MTNDLFELPPQANPASGVAPEHSDGKPALRRKKPRRIGMWVGIGAGVLVLAGAVIVVATSLTPSAETSAPPAPKPDPFAEATTICDTDGMVSHVGDGGHTLILEGRAYGGGRDETVCILNHLGVSEAVMQKMQSTRALDGRQEGSWPGYEASWTYHPDNGLDVIVTKAG